jgi:4-amino-4-deoxy-L-arabinose transferase-like glycosyltransferase
MKWSLRAVVYLGLIILIGLLLRLHQYDHVPPFGETRDEFAYPFAGLTLLQTGIPTSWSYFDAYTTRYSVNIWNQEFRLVTPWFDKPFLYPLLTGLWEFAFGIHDISKITLNSLRLLPIGLSAISVLLIGLIGKEVFGTKTGLLAALLYATVPTIVMANRLSLTENLLTPVTLLTLWLLYRQQKLPWNWRQTVVIASLAGLAFLTKQIGIFLGITVLLWYFSQKNWRALGVTILTLGFWFLVHLGYVAHYDLGLYLRVQSNFRIAHTLVGLPEMMSTIFQFPGISQKDRLFLDGSILAGLILLLSSPYWLQNSRVKPALWKLLLLAPFTYLGLLLLTESGATPYSYFGWHIYLLFPFMMLLLAQQLLHFVEKGNIYALLPQLFILGASSVRFIFLALPQSLLHRWEYVLMGVMAVALISATVVKLRWLRSGLLLGYLLVNVVTVLQLGQLYPQL